MEKEETQFLSRTYDWAHYSRKLVEAEAYDCDVPETAVHIYNQESYSYDDFS